MENNLLTINLCYKNNLDFYELNFLIHLFKYFFI